jgi:hypothetical protein
LLSAIVAVVSFNYGYGFGLEVSGALMGFIAGANCAILGVVLADAILARLFAAK